MEKKYCPLCEKEHYLDIIIEQDVYEIKDENITYNKTSYYFNNKNQKFITPDLEDINQLAIKDEYRKKHNLLTSFEIKQIRDKYSLSQSDLALILGWGSSFLEKRERKTDIAEGSMKSTLFFLSDTTAVYLFSLLIS